MIHLGIRANFAEARRALRKAKEEVNDAVFAALATQGVVLRGKVTAKAPRNTGKLANANKFSVTRTRSDLVRLRVFNRMPYAPYMEHGTEHGKMPPPDKLMPWVRRKLGITGSDAKVRAVAFLVARSILRRGGLAPRNWFFPTLEAEKESVQRYVRKHILKVLERHKR